MNSKISIHSFYLFLFMVVACSCTDRLPETFSETDKLPAIFPDYTELTLPPNIAPLNFMIKEPGDEFAVSISSKNGDKIEIVGSKPVIQIKNADWEKMLSENTGEELNVEVFCRNGDKWTKYKTIKHRIAKDKIDSYLSYRLINSAYVMWFEMGLYQRNLENFDEDVIIQNKSVGGGCINCHSLSKNNPEKFMFHIRANFPGTVIYK